MLSVPVRAVFYERDDAAAAADSLHQRGYAARVAKERFAGEDDELDHPWAVDTDAPADVVAGLVDDETGWLDEA